MCSLHEHWSHWIGQPFTVNQDSELLAGLLFEPALLKCENGLVERSAPSASVERNKPEIRSERLEITATA